MDVPPSVKSGAADRHAADVEALAARARAGEPAAIDALCEACVGEITRVLVHLGAGADELDDLVQNALLQLYRAIARFEAASTFRVWLYGLVARVYLHHKRTAWRLRRMVARFQTLLQAAPPPPIDDVLVHREALARVERCLASLSPKLRVVFVLREVEGLSGEEIARTLAIPVATVWTRLHHARLRLVAAREASDD